MIGGFWALVQVPSPFQQSHHQSSKSWNRDLCACLSKWPLSQTFQWVPSATTYKLDEWDNGKEGILYKRWGKQCKGDTNEGNNNDPRLPVDAKTCGITLLGTWRLSTPLVVLWKITHHWIPCGKKYGRKFSILVAILNLQALYERLWEMNPKMMQIPQGEKSIHKWLPPVKRYIASFKRGVLGDTFMACRSIMEQGINLLDALGVTHYLENS